MNEPENGVRAIQRLREMLLEERSRLVPVQITEVTDGEVWIDLTVRVSKGGIRKTQEILQNTFVSDEYELCLTYRKRPNKIQK